MHFITHDHFSGKLEVTPEEVKVSMPSNIALIKYMGRMDNQLKIPLNPSLSLTLSNLRSLIIARPCHQEGNSDELEPLSEGEFFVRLDPDGKNRFLQFWALLKDRFQLKGKYVLKSGNNFPSDCGIASSSSSFAALTVTAYVCAKHFENFSEDLTLDELAAISRIGSGASVRSFMNGVVLWDRLTIRQIELPIIKGGSHVVLVINDSKKKISSSQAHQRVSSSALLEDRPRRVKERLERMIRPDVSWQDLFMIVWNEFWDMMALFETSRPPFGYFCGPTVEILNFIRDYWENKNDGPLVTMDAGPNIHLIFRQDHGSNLKEELLREIKQRWNIQMFFSAI